MTKTSAEPLPPRHRRVEAVMGTVATAQIWDPLPDEQATQLLDGAFSWLHEVDRRFSTYRDDSEVNRLQAGHLRLADASAELRYVLEECARLWSQTDGYFDVYATGRLDPSGYVKGWSVQVASQRLASGGAVNHMIEAGGDIAARGRPAPDQLWRIGIRHPWQPELVCWTVTGYDFAVATSGTYERGLHVVNPRTGKPAADLRSVTVVGPDLAIADAYATAALAMGEAGMAWLATLAGYECAVITEDGRFFTSPGLPVDHGSLTVS